MYIHKNLIKELNVFQSRGGGSLCETQFSKSGLKPYIRKWECHSLWKNWSLLLSPTARPTTAAFPMTKHSIPGPSSLGSHEIRNHRRKMEVPMLKLHLSYLGVTLYTELQKNLVEGEKPHWVRISQISTWDSYLLWSQGNKHFWNLVQGMCMQIWNM